MLHGDALSTNWCESPDKTKGEEGDMKFDYTSTVLWHGVFVNLLHASQRRSISRGWGTGCYSCVLIRVSTSLVSHTHTHTRVWACSCTAISPSSSFLSSPFPLLHSLHLSFAISICSNEIYLASGECPSAMRDNISYKYQPPDRGSCNIYKGDVAVGDVNNVYCEQVEHPSKVHHLPTFLDRRGARPIRRLIYMLPSNHGWPDHIWHACPIN